MRTAISTAATALIAVLAVCGIALVAVRTEAGVAPGNGERVFDAPGCPPHEYDGLGPHALDHPGPQCPPPRPRILTHIVHRNDFWKVTWDGLPSYDPEGGRIVSYEWISGRTQVGTGPSLTVIYRRPGIHAITLRLADDRGVTRAGGDTNHNLTRRNITRDYGTRPHNRVLANCHTRQDCRICANPCSIFDDYRGNHKPPRASQRRIERVRGTDDRAVARYENMGANRDCTVRPDDGISTENAVVPHCESRSGVDCD
jgi:PKD domain